MSLQLFKLYPQGAINPQGSLQLFESYPQTFYIGIFKFLRSCGKIEILLGIVHYGHRANKSHCPAMKSFSKKNSSISNYFLLLSTFIAKMSKMSTCECTESLRKNANKLIKMLRNFELHSFFKSMRKIFIKFNGIWKNIWQTGGYS